jgi:hypothetical protein
VKAGVRIGDAGQLLLLQIMCLVLHSRLSALHLWVEFNQLPGPAYVAGPGSNAL